MARPTNRLSARTVAEAIRSARAGYHADGAGLYLLVTPAGTASWVYRYRIAGRLREMGLGSAASFTLAEARERARAARQARADGMDPIESRRALRSATVRTWGAAKEDFITAKRGEWKSTSSDPLAPMGAQEGQWRQSLDDYGPKDGLPVAALDTDTVLACLSQLWQKGGKVETGTRLRGRIERIWDAEKVRGTVSGENPARWRGHLEHLLPRANKIKRTRHHPAMPYDALPAFMAALRSRDGLSRKALEFTILTAARTDETVGMAWGEVNRKRALWTVPAERMKGGEAHEVPLTTAALAVLDAMPQDRPPFPLSEGGMLSLLQKDMGQPYTVHGFRSTFYDWVRDHGHAPDHVADAALAHKVSDEVKAAYGRSKLLDLRRALMEAWAGWVG